MDNKVRITNRSGLTHDTKVFSGDNDITSKITSMSLAFDVNEIVKARIDMFAEGIDVFANVDAIRIVDDRANQNIDESKITELETMRLSLSIIANKKNPIFRFPWSKKKTVRDIAREALDFKKEA